MSPPRANSFAGCTIVSSFELPKTKVLASSFLRFNPDAQFTVVVMDGPNDQFTIPNTRMLSLRDVAVIPGDGWRWPMLFGFRQLRELLKPALLKLLLNGNVEVAAHFSPSTEIFASLSDLFELVGTSNSLCVTDLIEGEYGDCGRSVVAAAAAAKPELRKWFEQLHEKPEPPDTQNRAEDIVGSLPHRVISRDGFSVNYSNLDPGQLSRSDDGYRIGDEPLQSFDFRGYEPDKPHLLSRYLGLEPRILLSEHPIVADLCDTYGEQLNRAGWNRKQSGRVPFEILPSGLRLDTRMLRIYRAALTEYKSGRSAEPPSPFGLNGEQGFLGWLNEPMDQAGAGVTRYMLGVYEDREDVRAAFPDATSAHAAGVRDWFLHFGQKELDLPAALVPLMPASVVAPAPPSPVNVAGYFQAELGIGAAARSVVAGLAAVELPINTVTFDRTANRLAYPFTSRSSQGVPDTNLVCINPDQISVFAEEAGDEFWHGRYSIGVWFWEVEDFPASLHHAFNYVDEIWVASEFMRESFVKVSPKPVFKFVLPVIEPPIDPVLTRSHFGLPEQFVFLSSFDFLSVLERKNPLGLIKAFKAAFEPSAGPQLVIKTINGDKRTLEMEKLKYAIRGRPDIVIKDGYLSAIENTTLVALADCYVALHRSEGFGLNMAEAMVLGKPVLATGYSGNLDFMTADNSYLCPARRVAVGPEREPYPADSYWAEPDLDVAASLLRQIYSNPEEAKARGEKAASYIRTFHSPAIAGRVMSDRIALIRQRRSRPGPARTAGFLQDRVEELEAENARLRQDFPR